MLLDLEIEESNGYWNDEDIFKLLEDEKGRHLDPNIIDLFSENIDEFKRIRDRYKD